MPSHRIAGVWIEMILLDTPVSQGVQIQPQLRQVRPLKHGQQRRHPRDSASLLAAKDHRHIHPGCR